MPVSTPQISSPRFFTASSVALFTSFCARAGATISSAPSTARQSRNIAPSMCLIAYRASLADAASLVTARPEGGGLQCAQAAEPDDTGADPRQIGSVEQTFYALHAQCLPHLTGVCSQVL